MSFQLAPKIFWGAELISQFFYKFNTSKYFTCPLGKLRTEFTSPIVKSTSPRLSDSTFFARCSLPSYFLFKIWLFWPSSPWNESNDPSWGGYGYFVESHKIDGGRLCPSHDLAKGHKILIEILVWVVSLACCMAKQSCTCTGGPRLRYDYRHFCIMFKI